MIAHAKLGASNAHRWLVCPGSVAAEEGLPDTSGPDAEEGTRAHALAERALREGPVVLVSHDDHDMAGHVAVYVNHVLALADGADMVEIERRVDYSRWVPGGFGTSDAIVLRGDTLHVCDLKYGRGVQVFAKDNPQGMLYALGAYAEASMVADVQRVVITIVQPRLDHIDEWEVSIDALLRWGEWAHGRAELALADDAERVPGEEQCRWCKAKAFCPALKAYTERLIMADFDALDTPKADKLSDDDLRKVLDGKALVMGWLSAVEDHVKGRLEAGEQFEGYKLVEGRANRQWDGNVEERLVEIMGEEAYAPRQLLSPAQAEKVLGRKRKGEVAGLIIKPHGKPALARADDPRPAIGVTDDDFDVVEGGADGID